MTPLTSQFVDLVLDEIEQDREHHRTDCPRWFAVADPDALCRCCLSVHVASLRRLRLGEWVVIEGRRLRVTAVNVAPAAEDDEELGIEAGDMVPTFELGPP